MSNSVIIKGNKYGIVIILDPNIPFGDLKQNLVDKFQNASNFFDHADMAVTFEGRTLSNDEERELLDVISEHSRVNIICVIDNDENRENKFREALEAKQYEMKSHTAEFYKGTLRSGQVLEKDSSLIILGDVNPGANVIAKGNVIIVGACKGTVFAGSDGNPDAFVIALDMSPIQIRIGDVIARSNDHSSRPKAASSNAMVAFVDDNSIYIENLDKDILNEIKLSS